MAAGMSHVAAKIILANNKYPLLLFQRQAFGGGVGGVFHNLLWTADWSFPKQTWQVSAF